MGSLHSLYVQGSLDLPLSLPDDGLRQGSGIGGETGDTENGRCTEFEIDVYTCLVKTPHDKTSHVQTSHGGLNTTRAVKQLLEYEGILRKYWQLYAWSSIIC